VYLKKESVKDGAKSFVYASRYDVKTAQHAERIVGIKDITTELTSVAGILEVPDLEEKTKAIVSLWRRGTSEVEKPLGVGVNWIIEEEVPNIITPEHLFYQRYAHLARGNTGA
jgi:hypothetical protein